MMTKTIYILLVTFIMGTACSQSQEDQSDKEMAATTQPKEVNTTDTSVSNQDRAGSVPSEGAKVAFKKQYPNAKEVSWAEDANGYHEASFTMDGEKYRADYTAQGKWVETENSLKFGKLPKAVQQVVTSKFNKDEITEIERVEHAERGVFYDVEFKEKGKNRDVEIRENGEIIKQ